MVNHITSSIPMPREVIRRRRCNLEPLLCKGDNCRFDEDKLVQRKIVFSDSKLKKLTSVCSLCAIQLSAGSAFFFWLFMNLSLHLLSLDLFGEELSVQSARAQRAKASLSFKISNSVNFLAPKFTH